METPSKKTAAVKPAYINISLDIQPKLLQRLTQKSKSLGITRAQLIRQLLGQPLKGEEEMGRWGTEES